ncbi:transposase [Streptomyces sp. NPDC059680]|uniref:transposase n=1 Tax=Streptomyces sp. NPDC059680 TaxID=3346904 RepID=UPI0036971946
MGTYKYSAEFRADAVALARSSGRPVSRIAAELGVNHETLRQWIKTAEKAERPEALAVCWAVLGAAGAVCPRDSLSRRGAGGVPEVAVPWPVLEPGHGTRQAQRRTALRQLSGPRPFSYRGGRPAKRRHCTAHARR